MLIIIMLFYFLLLSYLLTKWKWVKASGIKSWIVVVLFFIKVVAGFSLVYLYGHYYDSSQSDIYIYYNDATRLKDWFLNDRNLFYDIVTQRNRVLLSANEKYTQLMYWDSSSIDFLIHEKRLVILLNFIFSFIAFGSIYIHSLFMAFMGFLGQIAIFRFVKRHSQIQPVFVLLVSFLLPTFLLWSSTILKEPLIILSMGMLLFFIGKWTEAWEWKHLVVALLFFCLGALVKPYVMLSLSVPLFVFVMFKYKNKLNFKTQSLIVFGSFILIIVSMWTLTFVDVNLFEKLSSKQSAFCQTIELAEQTGEVGSQIVISHLHPSLLSFIYNSPKAFTNVMFKPSVYDFKNLLYLPDILQNLLIMFIGVLLVFKYKKPEKETFPFIWLSLLFFIILYIIIGLVTPVLGAIVRYKIPAIIFVFFFLLSFLKMNFNNKTILKFIFHSSS